MKKESQTQKISVRFFGDREVRAFWNMSCNKWLFSAIDICNVLRESNNPRRYWSDVKRKIKHADPQLYEQIVQFRIIASDGKRRVTDMLDSDNVTALAKQFPSTNATKFLDWFLYSEDSLDGQSKKKAYSLFESNLISEVEVGTITGLQQIHAYLFGGLYHFAGQIRTMNIAKDQFQFAIAQFLPKTLKTIESMPETCFEGIVEKYVEMNVAHPFMEGNGRSTRIWLDLMLKKNLRLCIDWSQINKYDYLSAMQKSVVNSTQIEQLLLHALTDQINDRNMFIKGIDYSYYYEQVDDTPIIQNLEGGI